MKPMWMAKVKAVLAVVLALGVAGTGAGVWAPRQAPQQAQGGEEGPRGEAPAKEPQPPKAAPQKRVAESRLGEVLREWGKANDGVQQARYSFRRTSFDRSFETREVARGEVVMRKPDLFRIDSLEGEGKSPTVFLSTGTEIRYVNPRNTTGIIFAAPPSSRERADFESVLWPYVILLPVGQPVRDLDKRFAVKMAEEDDCYLYLTLTPRTRPGRLDFKRARVVLLRKGYRVRQVWLERANGNEMTLDVERWDINPKPPITRESVLKNLPGNWKRLDLRAKQTGGEKERDRK